MAAGDKGSISLDQIKNETVDLERIPIEEVFEQLKCTREGLSSTEGENRIQIFGPNKLEEKKESKFLKFLGFMWNPLSWVMEAAALMAIALANGEGQPPDWQDFVGIICLLVINSTISFIEENNAGNAAAALMAGLAPKTKVLRDGKWSEQEAAILVPGDIISIKLGDIIPADARLLEGDPLMVDQAALTGESLPVTRHPGQEVFSGSTCKQGEIEAVVIATGVHTFFGKAAHLVDSTNNVGHFQTVLRAIGNFCICSIAVGMLAEIIVMYPIQHRKYREGIDNLLVLLIGGIPIAMPTVLSVTMAIGSHKLAQQGAITKRMTAIEEMAGMDVLCSDKTGTLTLNKLSVDRNLIEVFVKGVDKEHVMLLAARAARTENQDAIDAAIVGMLADPKEARAGIREVHFLPFNPVDKRTALTYVDNNDGSWHRASKGAPEQIMNLCNLRDDEKKKVHAIIEKFAERGLRSLGVARQKVPEKTKESAGAPWQFVGLLSVFDPPRHDSAETIRRALNLGVNVKMITGDQLAIAKETGRRLGMGTNMYPSSTLLGQDKDANVAALPVEELIEKADGFAGVFPEHKYEIVKKLQERKHIVAKSQFDGEDVTFNSRISVTKANPGKEGNGEIKRNIRCKVGFSYSFARKVPIRKSLGAASIISDNCGTLTKEDLFQKYWGLRKNVSANQSNEKSENQNINQKDCSEDMNLNSSSEKSNSFSCYFSSNETENCTDLHKVKKRCYRNDMSETEPMLSHLSSSDPSPSFIESQILQQTCLMNEDVKNNEDGDMSKKIAMSLDSSVDLLVLDAKTKLVSCSDNTSTMQQSESTVSVITLEDIDSLSHSSYASKQQETSECQEDSAYSLCTEADTDSLGNFQGAFEPSPISVLDSTFSEDISVISECGGSGVYDSADVDDEGLELNVSSDEDYGNESVGDFEEKKDITGLSRTEESRDFSYVVEVLTEAGISNASLFKDFSTWHSAECPISPSVFETLEKKFGEQQLWKRSERRLLFDRINLGLLEILRPYLYVPMMEKPVSRRMNSEPSQNMIEDEMWGLLVSQEKKAGKELADNMLGGGEIRWIELGEDVEDIVREIVKLLVEELVDDIVGLENF